MKTIIFTTVLFLFTIQNSVKEPPRKVLIGLKKEFPTAINIKWTEIDNKLVKTIDSLGKIQKHVIDIDNYWKAEFMVGIRKTSVTFDIEGHWLNAHQEITLKDIGIEEVKAAIDKDFSACKIISIELVSLPGLGTCYYVVGSCGKEIIKRAYDHRGWPPPRM